jgi:hypothetical protein
MSNPKPIDQTQFGALIASCSGSWSDRCIHPQLPARIAEIQKQMPGFAAAFFSGSLASAEYPKIGQLDVFREEMRLSYGDSDRVRKYSWVFFHEPDPNHPGAMIVVAYDVPAKDVPGHHDTEMADEFFEQFADAPLGKPSTR